MAKKRSNGDGTWWYDEKRNRWIGQLPQLNGKRPKTSAPTEKEVRAKLRQMALERTKGIDHTKRDITVALFLIEWLQDEIKPNVDPETYKSYESKCRCQIVPHIGKIKMRQLNARQTQHMFTELLKVHAVSTLHVTRSMLRSAFDCAVGWRLVTENVIKEGSRLPPLEEVEIEPLEVDQIGSLLDVAAAYRWCGSNQGTEALFIVALVLGLRIGEIISLQWSDVDFDAGVLRVRGSEKHRQDKTIRKTKTKAGKREIPLDENLIDVLKTHRYMQRIDRLAAEKWTDTGLVFPTCVGTKRAATSLTKLYKKLLVKAGLPRSTRFHDLRHTAISHMLANGARLKDVSEIAGHSDTRITLNTYGHAFDEGKRKVIEGMSQIVKRKKKAE